VNTSLSSPNCITPVSP